LRYIRYYASVTIKNRPYANKQKLLRRFIKKTTKRNLSKAHVTRDSVGPSNWTISVQRAIK